MPPTRPSTDWGQVVALYDQLLVVAPSPVVRLHRAVAVAEVDGPAAGLALVDVLAVDLDDHHLFHAVRADLLGRLGRAAAAREAYDAAITRAANRRDQALLRAKRDDLPS